MLSNLVQFASATEPASGISAFNINLKSFLFQLVTFVIVLLILKRWVLPPLVETMDKRRETLEKSLRQAEATQAALSSAETKAEQIIAGARSHADEALAQAKKSAEEVIVSAEAAGAQRAVLIIEDAKHQLENERFKLRQELKEELADLVADATQTVLGQKLNETNDRRLIEQALKEIG